MNIHVSYELVGLSFAIIAHSGATIWWASKITSSLDSLRQETSRLGRELEKRDEVFSAIWKRIDTLRDMMDAK